MDSQATEKWLMHVSIVPYPCYSRQRVLRWLSRGPEDEMAKEGIGGNIAPRRPPNGWLVWASDQVDDRGFLCYNG